MSDYCSIADVQARGLRADVVARLGVPTIQAMITSRSSIADGYLSRFVLPLVSWGADLSSMVARWVYYDASVKDGFSPEDATGTLLAIEKREADDWFLGVSKRTINPVGIVDSSAPPETDKGWSIQSDASRGW